MTDDLVAQLLNIGDELSSDYYPTIYDAAAEIERLRAAGDALAVAYRTLGGLEVAHDHALRAWGEARRG